MSERCPDPSTRGPQCSALDWCLGSVQRPRPLSAALLNKPLAWGAAAVEEFVLQMGKPSHHWLAPATVRTGWWPHAQLWSQGP